MKKRLGLTRYGASVQVGRVSLVYWRADWLRRPGWRRVWYGVWLWTGPFEVFVGNRMRRGR